jgi:RNA polymerase sigma factor (sigma-70 family)
MAGKMPPKDFATTHWSVVISAGRDSTVGSRKALETLCETYWQPLYYYARRRGHGVEEAEDLIQGFFLRLLEKGAVAKADRERGRFRTFLLSSLKNYITDEWKKGKAIKRGGGRAFHSLDFESIENLCQRDSLQESSPDVVFARRWAVTLMERVLDRLRQAYTGSGREDLFDELKDCLDGDSNQRSYREIGNNLSMTEGAVKMAVHRLRQRFRDTLRQEIAQTVADPKDIDDELQALRSAFG